IPVTQSAVMDATGRALLGKPQWQLGGLPESIVTPIELGFLGLGLVGTLLVAWRVATEHSPARAWRAFVPWALVGVLLFGAACGVMWLPMDMRGTFAAG